MRIIERRQEMRQFARQNITLHAASIRKRVPSPPTLLCLNDNKTALWVRKLVLERDGFRVLTATECNDALELLRKEQIDLVVADHVLQDTTGAEVAREMKRMRPGIPVVLLSGSLERPERTEHVDAFVSKIEGREALVATIRRLLAGKTP